MYPLALNAREVRAHPLQLTLSVGNLTPAEMVRSYATNKRSFELLAENYFWQ
jgi:hypothetical protein